MPTPFTDIYDSFLSKIDDPDLLELQQTDLEDIMFGWLKSAISRFKKCKQNIRDYDEIGKTFTVDLTLSEVEILSLWMKFSYLEKYIYRENLLNQSLSNKDYSLYSQAHHLQQLLSLRSATYQEINTEMIDYLYDGFDFDNFG